MCDERPCVQYCEGLAGVKGAVGGVLAIFLGVWRTLNSKGPAKKKSRLAGLTCHDGSR